MKDQARDYQVQSISDIRSKFLKGRRRVLLWLATGAGKTFVFCKMVKDSVSRGRHCIVVVRGRKLVDQASQRLIREEVEHGVLMSKHWLYRPNSPVQVCSIDTLIARKLRPKADLIIIDEAHLATSKGYVEFLRDYPDAFVVAVTATPWVDASLRHLADEVVHPIKMQELIDQGYLVRARAFAPSTPNLSSVRISASTKDYVSDDLTEAMTKGSLTGDIVEHWKRIASGAPTICFAVSVRHSKILVERFLREGIKAEHCDADSTDAERQAVITRLESGETKVVCNVGIFCTGVDIPNLGCIVMARPTKSRNLYIQQAGRGTRPVYASGFDLDSQAGRLEAIRQGIKPAFILLDHAGNCLRHGFTTEEPEPELDKKKKTETFISESKVCTECFAVYVGAQCSDCGFKPLPVFNADKLKEDEGSLTEIKVIEEDPVLRAIKLLKKEAKQKGRKPAWVHYKLLDMFEFELIRPHVPQWFIKKVEESNAKLFAKSPFKALVRD